MILQPEIKVLVVDKIISSSYPNTFNDQTTIEFTLPESGRTDLEVISLSGEVVERMDLGLMEGGMEHQHDFTPDAGLSGGSYLYRIISGRHVATGKLLYMK